MYNQSEIDGCIAEIKREIALRERVYPKWIAAGKLKEAQAESQINRMKLALSLLETMQTNGRVTTASFEGGRYPDKIRVAFPFGATRWYSIEPEGSEI